MPLQICILETDILRPELIDQYQGYGRMFEQLFAHQPIAAEFTVYNVMQGNYPPASEHYDAYLVTGSKADSFGSDPWIETLKTYLLERYAHGDKLLGICFGHQLLALLLGGKAERALPTASMIRCCVSRATRNLSTTIQKSCWKFVSNTLASRPTARAWTACSMLTRGTRWVSG